MKRIENASMAEYTSFKAGGKAKTLIIVESAEELKSVLKEVNEEGIKYTFIGNGSNTLVTDKGYNGTIIKTGDEFNQIVCEGERLISGCGALMSAVAKVALENSLTGFEFASGIPGSIGGAMFMNAGAYGGEIKDIVESVTVMSKDGTSIYDVSGEDMHFGYRHSRLQETGEVALHVTLKLEKGDKEAIRESMNDLTNRRNTKQPVQYPSAGSFFKRPEGYFAGKLIQDSGLRGVSVGGAQVSQQHCGFIINTGGATATDIINLMHLVQNTVYDKFGVKLEPEVRIIGD